MELGLVLLTRASCSSLHPCTMPRVWLKKKSMQTCVDCIIWIIYFLVLVWIHSMGGTCGSRTQESEVLVSGSFLKGILCSLSVSVSFCMCTCTCMHIHVYTYRFLQNPKESVGSLSQSYRCL